MFALLLLALPLLAEVASRGCGHHDGCVLPPASTEQFFVTGGAITYFQYPGERPNVINFNGNFSRVPQFPMEGITIVNGNRLTEVYYGVWDCYLSGPINLVFSHNDFIIGHRCLLGYDFAEIYTTVKEPNEELKELIWKVVNNHTEVDRRKFTKSVC